MTDFPCSCIHASIYLIQTQLLFSMLHFSSLKKGNNDPDTSKGPDDTFEEIPSEQVCRIFCNKCIIHQQCGPLLCTLSTGVTYVAPYLHTLCGSYVEHLLTKMWHLIQRSSHDPTMERREVPLNFRHTHHHHF